MGMLQKNKNKCGNFFVCDFLHALSPFLTLRDKVRLKCTTRNVISVPISATQQCLQLILEASPAFTNFGLRTLRYQDQDFVIFQNDPFHWPKNFCFALSFVQPGYLHWWFREVGAQCEWKEVSLHIGTWFRYVAPHPEYFLTHQQDLLSRVAENLNFFIEESQTHPLTFILIKNRTATGVTNEFIPLPPL